MPIQDRRPSFGDGAEPGEGVKPDESEDAAEDVEVTDDLPDDITEDLLEGEGTPDDPAKQNDPDGTDEESLDDVSSLEEGAVDAPVVEAEKPKVIDETEESLQARKASILEEIKNLRGERRQLKGTPFDKKIQSPDEEALFIQPKEDPLDNVNPDDRAVIEKVIEARLKSGGYVRKDELQTMSLREKVQQNTDAWLSKNEEFSKDNDPDDEKWNKINSYVSKMFAPPSNPDVVSEMLDIARERLFGKKTNPLPQKSIKSVAAKKEKIAAGAKSSSGGGVSQKQSSGGKISADQLEYLHGFSDEEKNELAS
uniref:Uncharacterized protein n=1 Tax=viral metagenome TaxID=1070528 RepID=A0A6H1ZI06_9ZZZZ